MPYIWQLDDWPHFQMDLTQSQGAAHTFAHESGRLAGGTDQADSRQQQALWLDLLVEEAISTSLIEGERINPDDVRSSIRNHLDTGAPRLRVSDPRAEGVASLLLDVRRRIHEPLTADMLFAWHRMILPEGENLFRRRPLQRGQWRTSQEPMQIVSGPDHAPTVHYEAPPSAQVPGEMARLITWFNETADAKCRPAGMTGPARAAVAHLWFEVIHPFDDGNGRVGRALAEKVLLQDTRGQLLLSLSSTLMRRRGEYYDALQRASGDSLDITDWVNWFCATLLEAQREAGRVIGFVLGKARFWVIHPESTMNERQVKVVRRLFDAGPDGFEGGMTAGKYQHLTRCSKATATRDLSELAHRGILAVVGSGRGTRYALALPKDEKAWL